MIEEKTQEPGESERDYNHEQTSNTGDHREVVESEDTTDSEAGKNKDD